MQFSNELLWIMLFMFLLFAVVFGVASVGSGKPYWRFGIGFGLVAPLMILLPSYWLLRVQDTFLLL